MKEWGWTNPVLADEAGGVIAGHARILAARQLGYAEVPVMVARGWSDAQKRAYVIADNQLALNAGWDRELLGLELGELKLGGFDLALTGFGELELGDLLADRTAGLTDPDSVCELRHVKIGTQDAALFEVPHDYARLPAEAAAPFLGMPLARPP
jgi:ParB-like chromosome segregation protein Spo0J